MDKMDDNHDLDLRNILKILRVGLDPCINKQVSLYIGVLNKYLDQFVKIKASEINSENQYHLPGMKSRLARLQLVCSDLLDKLDPKLDDELATILFQYSATVTVCKLSLNSVVGSDNHIKFNPNAIVNLTSINIPPDVLTILSLGPKFCFPNHSLNWPKTLAELEEFVENQLLPMEFNHFSRLISSRLQTVEREIQNESSLPNKTTKFLKYALISTKGFLKKFGEQILILNADKGNKTVVMHKDQYYPKISSMLSDTDTYLLLDENNHPFEKIKHKHHSLVDEFIRRKLINKCDKWKYCKRLYTNSKLYGLPKTHKTDYPLRPITSNVNALGYKLAKFLAEFLKNIDEQDPIHIINSLHLKQFLDTYTLPKGHILASFDVVNMFTNIPVKIAIQAVKARMLKAGHDHKNINLVYRSLEFLLTTCAVFNADCKLFQQVKGLAMGSPLSPILSKFVMSDFIKTIRYFHPLIDMGFFKIYVDDAIVSVHKSDIDNLLIILNSFQSHYNIQFVCEKETPSPMYNYSNCIHLFGYDHL